MFTLFHHFWGRRLSDRFCWICLSELFYSSARNQNKNKTKQDHLIFYLKKSWNIKKHRNATLHPRTRIVESPRDVPYGYKNLQECMYSLPTILPWSGRYSGQSTMYVKHCDCLLSLACGRRLLWTTRQVWSIIHFSRLNAISDL
jgi:hypothetical protein